jgi:hypothetical protein
MQAISISYGSSPQVGAIVFSFFKTDDSGLLLSRFAGPIGRAGFVFGVDKHVPIFVQ